MITKQITTKILGMGLLLTLLAFFNGCKEDKLSLNTPIVRPSVNFIGLTNFTSTVPSQLIRYNSSNANLLVGSALAITGLQSGESIVAIDYRPATGQLYGLGSTYRLYIIPVPASITASSVKAIAVKSTPFIAPPAGATAAGFDFNPVTDRIRIVTSNGKNYDVNPETGDLGNASADINGITGALLTGSAYTNNVLGATSTLLYGLDVANKKLYKQDEILGTITEVGSLGLSSQLDIGNPSFSAAYNTNITNARLNAGGGLDISPSGVALAVLMNNSAPAIPIDGIAVGNPKSSASAVTGTPTLYQINLETGKAIDLGVLPIPAASGVLGGTAIIGIAIPTSPIAYAVDETNELLAFNPNKPATIVTKPVTGLGAGENLLAIDFRQTTGQLYGLGSSSRLYTINTITGVATQVNTLPFTTLLSGIYFGFAFNPTTDLVRIVGNTDQPNNVGQDIIVKPALVATTTVAPEIVDVTGIAHGNAVVPPAVASTLNLYGVNFKTDKLVRMDLAAPALTATVVGSLGIDVEAQMGFDIGTTSNTAYGIFKVGTGYKIYTINLLSGTATAVADFPTPIHSMTLGLGF